MRGGGAGLPDESVGGLWRRGKQAEMEVAANSGVALLCQNMAAAKTAQIFL